MADTIEPKPTGKCWCGCGGRTKGENLFIDGHDQTAKAALMAAHYQGSVAKLLDHHGYGPDRSVLDEAVRRGDWVECPRCEWAGSPATLRGHRCTQN